MKRSFWLVNFFLFIINFAQAQYISRPEVVGSAGSPATFCQGSNFTLKFDAERMNGGNVFTVQLSSPTGNFNNPTAIGTLTATNGQNQFINARIPDAQVPGTAYRVRIRSSNPAGTISEPNEFPITVIPTNQIGTPEPDRYGINQWVAHTYLWTPVPPFPITNPAGQDFFNVQNYKGFFLVDSLSFDYDWGPGPMPGIAGRDGNFVACQYRENFSIRFRRRQTFAPGYYAFTVGGDDGIRLSTDGGATWVYDSFREQQYAPAYPFNGCGVFMEGTKDLVVEFFQRLVVSRATVIIQKTADPTQDPQIEPALRGNVFCSSTNPFQLRGAPEGGTWLGSGLSPTGVLDPSRGGTGRRILRYITGLGPCQKIDTLSVTIVPGSNARFSIPSTTFCVGQSSPVNLSPQVAGGIFSGPGVVGTQFFPNQAGIGQHSIQYIARNIATCPDSFSVLVTVSPSVSGVTLSVPSTNICTNNPPITLNGQPEGGVYSGPGVNNNTFNPAGLSGNIVLKYKVGTGACADSATVNLTILQGGNAAFSGLSPEYCTNQAAVNLVPVTQGGTFSGTGVSGNTFNPAQAGPGRHRIFHIVGQGLCADTQEVTVQVYVPPVNVTLSLPQAEYCGSSGPQNVTVSPAGGILSGPGVSGNTFNPAGLNGSITLKYKVSAGPCSDSASLTINVRPVPPVTLATDGSTQLCGSSPLQTLTFSPAGGILTGPGLVGNNQFNPSALTAGVNRFKYKFTAASGCADSAVLEININPSPDAIFNIPLAACYGDVVTVKASSPSGGTFTYNWTEFIGGQTYAGEEITFRLLGDARLQVRAANQNGACEIIWPAGGTPAQPGQQFFIKAALPVQPRFSWAEGEFGESPFSIQLKNESRLVFDNQDLGNVPANANLKYFVNWGDGSPWVQASTIEGLQHTYTLPSGTNIAEYGIKVQVRDETAYQFSNGTVNCVAEGENNLRVIKSSFPNVISPNGDNLNDVLTIVAPTTQINLSVYNRWGVKVFEESNYQNNWKAENLPSGTYYYVVSGEGLTQRKSWLEIVK